MKVRVTLAGLALWLALGAGAKHVRYGDAAILGIVSAEANLSSFAKAEGWQIAERIVLGTDDRYATLILKRPECPSPVAVMLLDSSDSVKEIFERAVKGDLAYVEAGEPHAAPPMAKLWLHNSLSTILSAFGGASQPAFPIVAVAPASALEGGACSLALISRWHDLVSLHPRS